MSIGPIPSDVSNYGNASSVDKDDKDEHPDKVDGDGQVYSWGTRPDGSEGYERTGWQNHDGTIAWYTNRQVNDANGYDNDEDDPDHVSGSSGSGYGGGDIGGHNYAMSNHDYEQSRIPQYGKLDPKDPNPYGPRVDGYGQTYEYNVNSHEWEKRPSQGQIEKYDLLHSGDTNHYGPRVDGYGQVYQYDRDKHLWHPTN